MLPSQPDAAEPPSQRELTIQRVFDVPARLLFQAHTTPDHVRHWFGPPGYPLALCEMDFRTGGSYRFGMKGPDDVLGPVFGGTYLDIIPNKKIAYTNRFEAPGSETMVVTVTFDEHKGKTTLSIHTLFGSVAQMRDHMQRGYETGVAAGMAQLATHAARQA